MPLPMLLSAHAPRTPTATTAAQNKGSQLLAADMGCGSTISAIFIPQSIPYSACVFRISYSANYTFSKFRILQNTLTIQRDST